MRYKSIETPFGPLNTISQKEELMQSSPFRAFFYVKVQRKLLEDLYHFLLHRYNEGSKFSFLQDTLSKFPSVMDSEKIRTRPSLANFEAEHHYNALTWCNTLCTMKSKKNNAILLTLSFVSHMTCHLLHAD